MQDIWNSINQNLLTEINDSGLLKAVLMQMQFLGEATNGEAKSIKLSVANSLSLNIANNELSPIIKRELMKVLGHDLEITFECSESQLALPDMEAVPETSLRTPEIDFKPKWFLNREYTLENFVDGDHSNFVINCLKSLSSNSEQKMNQFFLHGPSGMGKTHLLHALGWQFKALGKNVKLLCADEFINDYHMYIAKKQMPEFRGKYRLKTDVLLIDDIHSMSRAKGAQEELFNIFNYYEQNQKFIAFTSDKSPNLLEKFEERLLTRFQGGLSAELTSPDYETRIRILQTKSQKLNFYLKDEVITYIAKAMTGSVRALEGALIKVGTYQKMKSVAVTMPELERLIPQVGCLGSTDLSVDSILTAAAIAANLKVSDLKSTSRKREIVTARNHAMLRMREELSLSFAEIGRIFMKDHSTVITAIKRTQNS